MKNLITLMLIFTSALVFAQNPIAREGMPLLPLKVGDKVPNLSLGHIYNNPSNKSKFSEFEGKLLILIAFDTYCGTCLESFPEEEQLQKEFGDKVQLILVNNWESKEQIHLRLKELHIKLPDLPYITQDTLISKYLFPIHAQGTTNWIDEKGVVRVIDGVSTLTNTRKQIKEFLNSRKVSYLRSGIPIDSTTSIASIQQKVPEFKPLFSSSFFPYIFEYASDGNCGMSIDRIHNVKRITWINTSILNLYYTAFKPTVDKYLSTRIFGPIEFGTNFEPIQLNVRDTLQISNQIKSTRDVGEYTRSLFCYEQTLPLNFTVDQIRESQLKDLNNFFGSNLGIKCKIEKVKLRAYTLVYLENSIKTNKTLGKPSMEYYKKGKNHMVNYKNLKISVIIGDQLSNIYAYDLNNRKYRTDRPYVFNFTGNDAVVDMDLPKFTPKDSIKDVIIALKVYGFKLELSDVEVEMAIISDNKN